MANGINFGRNTGPTDTASVGVHKRRSAIQWISPELYCHVGFDCGAREVRFPSSTSERFSLEQPVGVKQFKHSSDPLIKTLNHDGITYFVFLFLISAGSLAVLIWGPMSTDFPTDVGI
ncbi:hypothetical protein FB451DRAFT_1184586 [Mycena latifolia]|nr:hypothetical protein FB451DRAFT_1184586 [Mycena latifolia]